MKHLYISILIINEQSYVVKTCTNHKSIEIFFVDNELVNIGERKIITVLKTCLNKLGESSTQLPTATILSELNMIRLVKEYSKV